jgi:hypothetical protein
VIARTAGGISGAAAAQNFFSKNMDGKCCWRNNISSDGPKVALTQQCYVVARIAQ